MQEVQYFHRSVVWNYYNTKTRHFAFVAAGLHATGAARPISCAAISRWFGMKVSLLAGLLAVALPGAAAAGAAAEPIRLELNRLEPAGNGCRVYLVIANPGGTALDSLKLDLVLFGTDGVIDRRLALEAGPLRAAKTSVKLFDLADYGCDQLGSILVNDVLGCAGGAGEPPDCFAQLALATRTPVAFTK
jgi:hypothetical protein